MGTPYFYIVVKGDKMKKILFLISIAFIVLTSTSCSRKAVQQEASFLGVFNTATKIISYGHNKDSFLEFSQLIQDDLERYHQFYDKYNEYEGINNIKTINKNAGIAPVKVEKEIIDMLLFSKEIYDLSDGNVNICLGPVLKIWHNYRENGSHNPDSSELPPMEILNKAMENTDINDLIIDEENSTVFLSNENMSLDVGSTAKGYAVEQVALNARNKGHDRFALNVGGNIRTIGAKDKKSTPWNIGIRNPNTSEDSTSLYTLSLIDSSLVSSGDYERYYTVDGEKYHHIIDPKTLMPANYFTAVSIVCEDSGMADSLSTAIFNISFEEGKSLIESLEHTEALWVFKDGTMEYSSGFKDMVSE